MAFITFLYIAYYAVSLFYLAFGVLLLTHPHFVEHHIPKMFPFLAAMKLQRIANSINLIIVGIILLYIGNLIVIGDTAGLILAFILSAWEVYLSITFYYYERRDIASAVQHFIIHLFLVIATGFIFVKYLI